MNKTPRTTVGKPRVMLRELDLIVITRDVPEKGIVAGDIGTIVHHTRISSCKQGE